MRPVFMYQILALHLLLEFSNSVAQSPPDPVVKIRQGKLRGYESESRNGKIYYAFVGIPFVDKPERFEFMNQLDKDFTVAHAPSLDPPTPWEGIRDARAHGPVCLNYNVITKQTSGEEDCLFLDVYSRQIRGKAPVMVYIHGGGFQWGTGQIHGPKYLMDENIVLVTFNYRLGPFGFLSTGDSVIQGNMGLKDQVAALRWVKQNIGSFGGDSDRITIFGESAGGGSVSLHLLSPMSKGLFHRAISQSGAALNPWTCIKNPKFHLHELAEKVGCSTRSSKLLKECLMVKGAHELVAYSFARWHTDPTVPMGPVVEKLRHGQSIDDVFLSEWPYEVLKKGSFEKVPWIVGVNEDEGILFHSSMILKEPQLLKDVNNEWSRVAPISLTFYDDPNTTEEVLNSISVEIKEFYLRGNRFSEETRQELTDMYSDRYFVHGVRSTAIMQAQQEAIVYLYLFTFKGSYSFVQDRGFQKPLGVTHKDELQYIFDGIGPDPAPGPERQLSENLIKLWTGFAATGVPAPLWGSVKQWSSISREEASGQESLKWLVLDGNTSVIDEPFTARMKFWDELGVRYPAITGYIRELSRDKYDEGEADQTLSMKASKHQEL